MSQRRCGRATLSTASSSSPGKHVAAPLTSTTADVQAIRENHMTLQSQFAQAQADAKTLSERPDNMTMLKLYSLYKQGSSGDVQGECPEMTDFVRWAKWDAWNKLKGTSTEAAQQQYIDLVESLKD